MLHNENFGFNKTSYSYILLLLLVMLGILGIVAVYATRPTVSNVSRATAKINLVDATVTHFVNQFVRQNPFVDGFVNELTQNNLLKGGFSIAILLYLWFSCDDPEDQRRGAIMATILFAVMGVAVVRVMTHFLPYRDRPIYSPEMNLVESYFIDKNSLIGWSSFPSDHATLFFTMAIGIYLISRRLGIIALLHAIFIVCLPRLYLGIHWSTDLLVGAVIGIFVALLGNTPFIRHFIHRMTLRIARFNRPLFYSMFFLLCYLVITLFEDARHILVFAFHVLRGHF